jgi:hypothetical protein
MKKTFRTLSTLIITLLVLLIGYSNAQTQNKKQKLNESTAQSTAAGSASTVTGFGTTGQLVKWTSLNTVGDSIITEDKNGKIGIGTLTPTSKLTVQGMIETTLGGVKFPDGTVQTSAAIGLSLVFHDFTLTGNGTNASPLGITVPLILYNSSTSPTLQGQNTMAGAGVRGIGGDSGVEGFANHNDTIGGTGVIGYGGSSDNGQPGTGVSGIGGNAMNSRGGQGRFAKGGESRFNGGGNGLVTTGGIGNGVGNSGGTGLLAYGGLGLDGATNGIAAYFSGVVQVSGDVQVFGTLIKSGGSFKIDHSLDPENKYLSHLFVESPDMKNIYDGVAKLDANGEAVVEMANWFTALNRDYRYLLTPIGAPAPGLYIAEELTNNRFKVAGGVPGMKVSWQVTGIRQDAWANKHRIPVEENKAVKERGFYLNPDAFNQPEEKHIDWARNPDLMNRAKTMNTRQLKLQ